LAQYQGSISSQSTSLSVLCGVQIDERARPFECARRDSLKYCTSSSFKGKERRCRNSSTYSFLATVNNKHTVSSTSSRYTFLSPPPDTSLPRSTLERKHGPAASRLMAAAAGRTHSTDLPSVSVSVSAQVCRPDSISLCLSRTLPRLQSPPPPRPPLVSYHSKSPIQPTNPPTYPAVSTQLRARHLPNTRTTSEHYHHAAAPARKIANKLQIKRHLFRLPDQTNGRRAVHHPN